MSFLSGLFKGVSADDWVNIGKEVIKGTQGNGWGNAKEQAYTILKNENARLEELRKKQYEIPIATTPEKDNTLLYIVIGGIFLFLFTRK